MTKFLDKKAVAELLGISVRSVDSRRQNGGLPCHILRGGAAVRFVEDEVIAWALGHNVNSDQKEEVKHGK
jgi:predicted DNA-binding transcriptional regulator AlpA